MTLTNTNDADPTQTVIDALYDLPLGGSWRDVQSALCNFWQLSSDQPGTADIKSLERHFDRAMVFLERLPPSENRWRHELFRIPVPACVIDKDGNVIEANAAGQRHLGGENDPSITLNPESRQSIRAGVRDLQVERMACVNITSLDNRALSLFVSKLPEQLHSAGSLYLAVMVTRDLPIHGVDILTRQYGLTAAEANLCLRLSAGNSLDDVAQNSSAKKTTLRTHLANSFSKMGVKSQPELVSLVLHSVFAAAHLNPSTEAAPELTPHLDPEIHGHPRFIKFSLPDSRIIGCFEYGDPDGIPAFYLHGSMGSGLFMKSQRLHKNGVRLLAVERGGVGETSPNPDPSPQAYARDILKLADHLKLKEFAVIGRSMGSWDAISLALEAQDRVRLVVLAGGRLPVQRQEQHEHDPFYTMLYNSIWHSDTMGRLLLRMMFLQLMTRGPEHFIGRNKAAGLEEKLDQDPLYARHMRASWLRCAQGGADPIHKHLKLYRDPVPDPPWLNFATRTILIHGIDDKIVPYERLIEQTASFNNRRVMLLPNVGHRLVQLAMGEVLRTVRASWEDLDQR
jgi:pimeloyl-ACP methyl ester carboxylesterase/DNA-binding CsgD family transcriptional regulator